MHNFTRRRLKLVNLGRTRKMMQTQEVLERKNDHYATAHPSLLNTRITIGLYMYPSTVGQIVYITVARRNGALGSLSEQALRPFL